MDRDDRKQTRRIRVAVVGGGPAGAFFSIQFLSLARRKGISAEVSIFEPKLFEKSGASNCNYCQGVVSASLVAEMERLGLALPQRVIQREVTRYRLHTNAGSLCLEAPPGGRIYTVYRGHGPNPLESGPLSFDQFLLDKAVALGARKVTSRVSRVKIRPGDADPVFLADSGGNDYFVDVVVGAFGVNTAAGYEFEQLGFGYHRPATHAAVLAEYPSPATGGCGDTNEIVVFVSGRKPVQFGVVTPKKDYATVSLVGRGLSPRDMSEFMDQVSSETFGRGEGGPLEPRCRCAPRFPVRHSKRIAAAHCLIIGDAGISRFYKKGIDSALRSADLAAEVLSEWPPEDESAMRERYERRIQREFRLENRLGQMMFRVFDRINGHSLLARAQLNLARGDCLGGVGRDQLLWVLWNMFTGDAPYRRIFLCCLDPRLVFGFVCGFFRAVFSGSGGKLSEGGSDGKQGR